MNIDRALQEYQTWVESDYSPDLRPHINAVRLAFEALKYIVRSRGFGEYPVNRLLPGETES